jgi:hypothetical protein
MVYHDRGKWSDVPATGRNVMRAHDLLRNSATLEGHIRLSRESPRRQATNGVPKAASNKDWIRTMTTVQKSEPRQDSQRQQDGLDSRYGKIGISAVAAALCHRGDRADSAEPHLEPYDRD